LAKYAVPVPCYICGGDNALDSELCRHCDAPMALAHQAGSDNVQPRTLAVIGTAGSGKTVYLGMLMDMLSRTNDRLQVFARGAFSITLQQETMAALARCGFPGKTPGQPSHWNWVHCQARMSSRRRPLELIIPDVAGDSLMEEIERPYSYPVIRSLLTDCSGIMALIDTARIENGDTDQECFAMKALTYLSELDEHHKKKRAYRPIAIVLTKADQCESCSADPAEYVRRHTPGLWQYCQQRFRVHRCFAASVAGACAVRVELGEERVEIPLRVEPHGVVEPFEWLVGQFRK